LVALTDEYNETQKGVMYVRITLMVFLVEKFPLINTS
jgi:hypothetical protein